MRTIKLKDRLDVNIIWRLVMNGKFQKCINDFDVLGNTHVNKIIEQILEIYLEEVAKEGNSDWDIRGIYIEETQNFSVLKEVVSKTGLIKDMDRDKKIEFIKDIVYPYKIKLETIKLLIDQKEKHELCDNCFEHRIYTQYMKQDSKPEDDIVCYDITVTGKVSENSIKEIKIDIDRYLD